MPIWVREIVRYILMPFTVSIALIAFGLIRKRNRWTVAGFALLLIASIPALTNPLWLWMETRYPSMPASDCPSADVVFVLGGFASASSRLHGETIQWNESVSRFEDAVELMRLHKAPVLLLPGAREAQDFDSLIRNAAVNHGVPVDAIRITAPVANTAEEITARREYLRGSRSQRAIVVTSAVHMPRAMVLVHRAGIDGIPFPVDFRATEVWDWRLARPSPASLARTDQLARELVGNIVYSVSR